MESVYFHLNEAQNQAELNYDIGGQGGGQEMTRREHREASGAGLGAGNLLVDPGSG